MRHTVEGREVEVAKKSRNQLALALAVLISVEFAGAAAAESDERESVGLLAVEEGPIYNKAWTRGTSLQLDDGVLRRLETGQLNKVAIPVAGRTMVFEAEWMIRRQGPSTWAGKEIGGDAKVLLTLGDDHLFGRVRIGDKIVQLEPASEPYRLFSFELVASLEVPLVHDEVVPPTVNAESNISDIPIKSSDDGSMIDLMVLYTDGLAADHPGAQINTKIQSLIDLTNQAYSLSGINTEVQLVHSAQVAYPDNTGTMDVALNDLTSNIGVFSGVEALRTTHGADQVTLLRKYVNEGCGLAWILTSNNARYSYSVVHSGNLGDGSYCSEYSFPHELGHNQGCAHDPQNASNPGRYSYSYGHQATDGSYRTVMAYSSGCPNGGWCTRTDNFANPNVNFSNGLPTGIADQRDNVRTINLARVDMAGYRAHVVTDLIFSDSFEDDSSTIWDSTVP